MEQFVGLDVSQKLTHICVVDREGKALGRGSSPTTPEDIAAAVRAHAPGAVRIDFETGALSTWLWHGLKKIGLPIVCLDARHAKAVLRETLKNSAPPIPDHGKSIAWLFLQLRFRLFSVCP